MFKNLMLLLLVLVVAVQVKTLYFSNKLPQRSAEDVRIQEGSENLGTGFNKSTNQAMKDMKEPSPAIQRQGIRKFLASQNVLKANLAELHGRTTGCESLPNYTRDLATITLVECNPSQRIAFVDTSEVRDDWKKGDWVTVDVAMYIDGWAGAFDAELKDFVTRKGDGGWSQIVAVPGHDSRFRIRGATWLELPGKITRVEITPVR